MDFGIVWNWVLPIGAGITVGSIIIAVAVIIIKVLVSKLINKFFGKDTIENIADKVTQKSVDKIKKLSFTQTIQPLAESELMKVREESNKMWSEKYKILAEQYNLAVDVVEKFADYFENSIGVSEEKKEALKNAIANMRKSGVVGQKEVQIEVQVVEDEKVPVKAQETAEKPAIIER